MRYFVVDVFTERLFSGNPAGVCILDSWLTDDVMQNIAAENNLAETAFAVKSEKGYGLRWFTPETEIDLCGHATIATAFIIANFYEEKMKEFIFETRSGVLTVTEEDGTYTMDMPATIPSKIEVTDEMKKAVGTDVLEAYISRDLILVLEDEEKIVGVVPDHHAIVSMDDVLAVVVTSEGSDSDFVSRFFAPSVGIPEDPVTGSSHSSLVPLWSGKLGKMKMIAKQLSRRGGVIGCEYAGGRVRISGKAVLYLEGNISILME